MVNNEANNTLEAVKENVKATKLHVDPISVDFDHLDYVPTDIGLEKIVRNISEFFQAEPKKRGRPKGSRNFNRGRNGGRRGGRATGQRGGRCGEKDKRRMKEGF